MRKLILVFLFFNQLSFASFDMNENMERSYSHIINLEFDKAAVLLDNEQFQNPRNGFILLHRNYIDFLTIFINEDITFFESKKHFKEERISLLDEYDETSPYFLYTKAEITLQWAFSRLRFEQYFIAAYEIIESYNLLRENSRRFPNFTLNNKGIGLIHALLGLVPDNFQWLINIAGLEGGVSMGISELDAVLNDDRFIIYEDEILFLLSFFEIHLGNNDSLCQSYLDRIGDRYKESLLLNFAAARLSYNLGENDHCITILSNRPDYSGKAKFYHLDYLMGMSYLYMLDYENAKQRFKYFLEKFGGINYIKSANHKLAWIALLQDDYEKARIYFERVLIDGNNIIDEDKVAFKNAQRKNSIHIILLRSRLLYDGGYYSLALSELTRMESSVDVLSNCNQIEYWYRLARVSSKLKYSDDIILLYYKKVLEKELAISSYYAPMSALQVGLIYEERGDFQQGEFYFNQCLSMSDFDYERAIHKRAKAGLNRILISKT